ncbi:Sas10/Utp3 family protein [Blastomyces dermatitidis ER-3]|uniref:Sas10/Utp3 family protein n=1 Tax=Ajellomyces dermatitidis (strain ER-3 / ATCC MYA-2586) TaxID=559297 RepID=A0ABP2ESU6_AJEDR|nr:Sas10/Utp3 family protein [Blastomyces dermatitidis ER-3]EEQ85164.2 Sas10/Utp3 family protein [Blastomyces dermatitidis ER-3]
MGKKRKASKLSSAKQSAPPDQTSRFAADATFTDSEDEFEQGRDRILLEEAPEAKRRRKLAEQEEIFQPSDEEVLGYLSESIDGEDFDDDVDYDEEEEDARQSTLKKPTLRLRNATSPMGDDEEGEGRGEEEDEGMKGWGSSRKDYYDADVIETEADAFEEEAEAKKIQQQRLQAMNEADFGFDESEWVTSGKDGQRGQKEGNNVVTEVLPELQVTDDISVDERRKILKQRYPEFEPLSKDFLSLQCVHEELAAAMQNADNLANGAGYSSGTDNDYVPLPVVKFRALSAYLGAISMYFFLLTSPSRNGEARLAMSPVELREHPIMETLINCKKQWEEAKGVQEIKDSEIEPYHSTDDDKISKPANKVTEISKTPVEPKRVTKTKKTKAQKAAEDAKALSEKKRNEKLLQTEAELADLSNLLNSRTTQRTTKQAKKPTPKDADSDFGDETPLDALEAEEKAKKKKSLRFYTSQIAQKANKRDAAGRDAGGDTDLPYRERLKDRQARLDAQAEKRGQRTADDLHALGGDSDEDDHRLAREVRGDKSGNGGAGSDSDDYYDMVAALSKQKKADKKKLADAHAAAAREGKGARVEFEETIGEDGKRAITYAIAKNKGLTPKRSKDVRNPRVKKKKKYEEKKKKLGSIRQVYKGGEGRGGYGGELTGIKTNLVKSVKL